jgi:hypothetical protein
VVVLVGRDASEGRLEPLPGEAVVFDRARIESRRLAFHSSKMAAVVRVMPLDEITQEAYEAVLV